MLGLSLKVGEEVPVICRLYDEDTTKFPQAVIRDDEGNLLNTLDLSHESNGAYVPSAPYNMPDEDFIKVYFDVYNEVGHTTLSILHLPDMDIFKKVVPDDYKATGFSTHSADDVKTSMELTGSKLSRIYDTEIIRSGSVSAIISQYLEFTTNLAEVTDNYWTRGAIRFTSGNNEGAIRKIQIYSGSTGYIKLHTELVNTIQAGDTFDIIPLRAFRVNNIDVTAIQDDIIAEIDDNEAKIDTIITNIGNLNNLAIADVQSAMTAQGYTTVRAALLDNLDAMISSVLAAIPADLADVPTTAELNAAHGAGSWEGAGSAPTVGEIDAQLTGSHGGGSWQKGDGMSEVELHVGLDNYANKDDWKATVALLATELNATENALAIVNEVNENETKIDVIGGIVTDIKIETDKIPAMVVDLTFLKDIEGGNWERDGSQMIFKTALDVEVARFNLFKFDGTPATEDDDEVAKREHV